MEDMTDEERKYCKIGLINPLCKQKKFKKDFKCSLFIILSQYYKKFHDNNRSLVLPVETIQRNNNYMQGSDELYSWINNTYSQSTNNKECIKLKDIFNEFKLSDHFRELKKEQKRLITYNSFTEKLKANLFLKNYVKQNSDKTLCLYSYTKKDDDSDDEIDALDA